RVPAAGYQGGAESASAVGSGLVGTFLAREREFLQGMAGLIQRHAEAIKGDVRRVRPPAPGASSGPAPEVSAIPVTPAGHGEPGDDLGPDDLGSDEPGPDLGPQELSEAFATHVGASLGTSRETAAGPKMEPAPDDDETGAERSLRELFWGED